MAKMTDTQKCRCFLWMTNMLRARKYTREELSELMLEQSFYQDQPILDRKTFRRFLDNIEELYGVNVEMDSHRRYYIPRPCFRSDFQEFVDDALALMEIKDANKSFEDQVYLDPIPVVDPWLTPIGRALSSHNKIHLIYKKFEHKENDEYILEPLALRRSKQRWYLLAYKAPGERRTFSFDRIVSLQVLKEKFKPYTDFSAKEHYKHAVGVYVDGYPIEQVIIRTTSKWANYIRTNPISPEQEEVHNEDGTSTFTLKVRVNVELENELITMVPEIDIIQPLSLRERIVERLHLLEPMKIE